MPISRVAALLLVIGAALVPRCAGAAAAASVRDFGAAGDDVTDDTPAIQRAIDSVGEAGVVFFPPGTYRVTQLRIGSRMALVGAAPGAVTLRNHEPAGRNFSGMVTGRASTGDLTDVEIRNLTFERTVETDAFDEHVYLENCRRVVIENSRFVGRITRAHHAQKGVHLRGCRYARILNNVFEDIADNALALNWLDPATIGGPPRDQRQRLRAHVERSRLPDHRDPERRHRRGQHLPRPGAGRPGRQLDRDGRRRWRRDHRALADGQQRPGLQQPDSRRERTGRAGQRPARRPAERGRRGGAQPRRGLRRQRRHRGWLPAGQARRSRARRGQHGVRFDARRHRDPGRLERERPRQPRAACPALRGLRRLHHGLGRRRRQRVRRQRPGWPGRCVVRRAHPERRRGHAGRQRLSRHAGRPRHPAPWPGRERHARGLTPRQPRRRQHTERLPRDVATRGDPALGQCLRRRCRRGAAPRRALVPAPAGAGRPDPRDTHRYRAPTSETWSSPASRTIYADCS